MTTRTGKAPASAALLLARLQPADSISQQMLLISPQKQPINAARAAARERFHHLRPKAQLESSGRRGRFHLMLRARGRKSSAYEKKGGEQPAEEGAEQVTQLGEKERVEVKDGGGRMEASAGWRREEGQGAKKTTAKEKPK